MSVREIIWFFQDFDSGRYLDILKNEHAARPHTLEPEAYVADGSPFYDPFATNEFTYIVGFNKTPLPRVLIDALTAHPELAMDDMYVIWTIEAEIILETTIGRLRHKRTKINPDQRKLFRQMAQTPLLHL